MRKGAFLVAVSLTALFLFSAVSSVALDLFAKHEVTAQFAGSDGKPMANAEVQVVWKRFNQALAAREPQKDRARILQRRAASVPGA